MTKARPAVAGLVLIGACAHRTRTPSEAMAEYGAAVARGDCLAAYSFLASPYRARVSLQQYVERCRVAAAANAPEGARLRDNAGAWGSRVLVTVGDGATLALVEEEGGFRLEEPPNDLFRANSPKGVLKAFIRAVESKRYDLLADLAPERHRQNVSVEALRAFWERDNGDKGRALMAELRSAVEGRLVESDTEAYLLYGPGKQLRFVKEDGSWRIENPE